MVTLPQGRTLVSTTDFFYPIVQDPYLQGQIAASNVLSDLYALGVTQCDTMLMVLGETNKLGLEERNIVTAAMMRGFYAQAAVADTTVTGGQSIINPWPIIGGVAIAVCPSELIIHPVHAQPGDTLVLTKPLGTQIAGNLFEWYYFKQAVYEALTVKPSEGDVNEAFNVACEYMKTLNRTAASLMHKCRARGATDVTGFGLLGHAGNLAAAQLRQVDLKLHTLPVIKGLLKVDKQVRDFKLREGLCAETSGGLLVVLPRAQVAEYLSEYERLTGKTAWVVGEVQEGTRRAYIAEDVQVLEV